MSCLERFRVVIRDVIKNNSYEGTLCSIFDTESKCFLITDQYGSVMEEREANEVASHLNRIDDAERFGEFLHSGCIYRTRKQHVGKFSTEFKRWLKGRKLPAIETMVGYDPLQGWFLRIKAGGVIDV